MVGWQELWAKEKLPCLEPIKEALCQWTRVKSWLYIQEETMVNWLIIIRLIEFKVVC